MKSTILFTLFISVLTLFSASSNAQNCSLVFNFSPGSPVKTKKELGLAVHSSNDILKLGDKIKTPGGLKLEITKVVLDGHKGIVYKGIDKKGKSYAVKIPRHDLGSKYDVIETFKEEIDKMDDYEKLKIPYAHILEYGKDYLIKDWIEGIRGDEWLKKWEGLSKSEKEADPKYIQLMALYDHISSQGAYVGNLKSINLIHDGNQWIVVDSSIPKFNYDKPERIRRKYDRTFDRKWIHWYD